MIPWLQAIRRSRFWIGKPNKLLLVHFEVLGEIRNVETIASGRGIRVYSRLVREFGKGNWRKMKGFATIRLANLGFETLSYTGIRRMVSGSEC
jgi:hypothetical protein